MYKSLISREEALALLKKHNRETFHMVHALTVESLLGYFAKELGYGEEREYWEMVGLLHDIDFEEFPDCHLENTPRILEDAGAGQDMIRSILSHGYGICSDIRPEHEMEKILFAADELSGLIGAAALVRPSQSVSDMKASSVKKKFKQKSFAAGCSRETIQRGADALGWTLDDLIARTLEAMQATEGELQAKIEELGLEAGS